jgi:cysteine synthase A
MNVLDAIGNTALVPLKSGVLVKLEMQNPTGSMKDRMAQAMLARPESDGRLKPGDTIVEYTGGSTGASLALVCAVKGHRLRIVTSDAFSREKRDQMAAFGAELTIIPSDRGNATKELFLEMIATARKYSAEPNTYWTNQLENRDSIAGYYPLGEEIWRQTNGEVDAFVQSVGTSASLQGVATVLKRYKPSVRIIAVEPAESPVLSGGSPGPHQIEGIGIGYTPPMWDPSIIDEVIPIPTNDAKDRARRLAREEGIFAGTSSGANVLAAERLAPNAKVVTLMVDSGLKYVKDLYRS